MTMAGGAMQTPSIWRTLGWLSLEMIPASCSTRHTKTVQGTRRWRHRQSEPCSGAHLAQARHDGVRLGESSRGVALHLLNRQKHLHRHFRFMVGCKEDLQAGLGKG